MITNEIESKATNIFEGENAEIILKPLDSLGSKAINKSNKLLNSRIVDLENPTTKNISNSLLKLNNQIRDLNPSKVDFVGGNKGILAPLFNPVKNYFAKFKKASKVITDTVKVLNDGQNTLYNDNETMKIEIEELKTTNIKIKENIVFIEKILSSIREQIKTAELDDNIPEEKIKFVKTQIEFPLTQKVRDYHEVEIVNNQGILSMELVIESNKELIRNVERSKIVSVTALSVGATLGQALTNQKIVLDASILTNEIAGEMLEANAIMLEEQGTQIQEQSINATISPEKYISALERAIKVYEDIEKYKVEALPKMKEDIDNFREIVERGDEVINRIDNGKKVMVSD